MKARPLAFVFIAGVGCGDEQWSFDVPVDASVETASRAEDAASDGGMDHAVVVEAGGASDARDEAEQGPPPPSRDAAPGCDGQGSCGTDAEAGCSSDEGCPAGERCDAATGACVQCLTDDDCALGTHCLAATGACVQCVDTANCIDGVCNTVTNTCIRM